MNNPELVDGLHHGQPLHEAAQNQAAGVAKLSVAPNS
jgi:hypothetical protein